MSSVDMFLSPFLSGVAVVDKDLGAAKALHQQMQAEGVLADDLSLKRLAALYRNHGETAPFPEPPVSRARVRAPVMGSGEVGVGSNAQEVVPLLLLASSERPQP